MTDFANDPLLCELTLKIEKLAGEMERIKREGKEGELFQHLKEIARAAEDAGFRLNVIKFKRAA